MPVHQGSFFPPFNTFAYSFKPLLVYRTYITQGTAPAIQSSAIR